jgi:predicted Zn-dependent protease
MSHKVLDADSFQGLSSVTGRLAGLVRRKHRHTSLILISTAVLGFAVTAAGHDPAESLLRQGTKLLHRGFFADSVAMFTRVLEQNPKDVKACYYRALANEMVDRQAAIGDWRRFVDLVAADPDSKEEVTQAEERLHALAEMAGLPESLRPSRYVPKAGDYYEEVAGPSVGLQWTQFPVKVYADSTPGRWQRPLQYGLDAWNNLLPLRRVSARQEADIIISWARLPEGMMGKERSFRLAVKENDKVVRRQKTSSIILENSHHLSGSQMRLTLLHELGHALGINGHSGNSRDVMLSEVYEMNVEAMTWQTGGTERHAEVPWRLIDTKLSRRDVNTLIRLYNCPGPLVHLK